MPNFAIPTGPWVEGQTGHFAWSVATANALNLAGKFLDENVVDTSALATFFLKLQFRSTTPVVWVACGSSTTMNTSQTEAERYPGKIVAEFQKQYPSSATPAPRTLAQAVASPPSGAGIHMVNAGISGTQSGGGVPYLTSTTINQIVALGPAVVSHMIGSNDESNGVPSATYESNLRAILALFDTAGYRSGHVLFHSYPRMDATAVANRVEPHENYLLALRRIAADRADVSVIDLSPDFRLIGIPENPIVSGLMLGDGIHLTPTGQTFMAKLLVRKILGFTMPEVTITDPGGGGTVKTVYTSDAFTGTTATSMSGKSTDATLGGSAQSWQSNAASGWGINSSKQLYRSAAQTSFLGIQMPSADMAWKFTVPVMSDATVGSVNTFDFRRAATANGSDAYRAYLRGDGSIFIVALIGSAAAGTLADLPAGTYVAGSVIEGSAVGTTIKLSVDGSPVMSVTDSQISSGSFAGFAKSSAIATAVYDDLVLYTYV